MESLWALALEASLAWHLDDYIKSAELFIITKIMKKLRFLIFVFSAVRAGDSWRFTVDR
ncbi:MULTISPECIES: hypothetical protein [unclassified Microcoleus]|uniref:hypothetical protein n=1 Tax=unclassified Microcoleus TaxID=2642155 RepID=UPI0025E5845B|nr:MULTISPECIES: hypothetical protein [unclassified Microcoleus]